MDEIDLLKAKADSYRRLMRQNSDPRTVATLTGLIAEIEAKIAEPGGRTTATQCEQEQPTDGAEP